MLPLEPNMKKYAKLAVQSGLRLGRGQQLVIVAPLEAAPFVRMAAECAYEAGAGGVHTIWSDDELTRLRFIHTPIEAFDEFPQWEAQMMTDLAREGAAFLHVRVPNPDLLENVDPEKIAREQKAKGKALKFYKQLQMADRFPWTLVAVPSRAWAKKVFPHLNEDEAVQNLWETIFRMTRIDREDPNAAWEEHQQMLAEKARYLNEKRFKKLHYRAEGTNLTIELPQQHRWLSAGAEKENGRFIKNIPTEEVFTLPKKDGVHGIVKSTMPLNYNGTVIDGIELQFSEGRVVDFSAKRGEETLARLLATDEGAKRLGEVALVPNDSPISRSGLIFYHTLFDENASCHLALGKAYPTCLSGGREMNEEELAQNGANESLVHVDFMIGSDDLSVEGETADGRRFPILTNGLWAF